MPEPDLVVVEKLTPPYRSLDVVVQPEQEQFIDPVEKAIAVMAEGEVAFVVRSGNMDVGFFTLRPSANDEVEQLRGRSSCTLRSFMIDARHQGKGFAYKALALLPTLASANFPGLTSVGLTVNCRNTQAHRLYERNGFQDLGDQYHGGSAGPQHIMTMMVGR